MSLNVLEYTEKQRTVLLHDYLVYVCGVEISRFVEDITITYNDRNSPSSCDITVTNALDQFVLTSRNLLSNSWRNTEDKYTEAPKLQIYTAKRRLSTRVAGGKLNKLGKDPKLESDYTSLQGSSYVDAQVVAAAELQEQDFLQRYSFGIGSVVFSRFDTVRVFIKNPEDPPEMDRWIPAFTGTVQNKPFNTDYVSGASTIQLNCTDIRGEMSGMRVSVNPVTNSTFLVGNSNEDAQRANLAFLDSDQSGFFKDLYPTLDNLSGSGKDAKFDNIFADKSFVDSVSMIITGLTGWVSQDLSYAKANQGNGVINQGFGIGFFNPGEVYRYGNPENKLLKKTPNLITSLEKWDNLCLFGRSKRFFSKSDCSAIGRASFWYRFDLNAKEMIDANGNNQQRSLTRFTPFDGYMHFLMPVEGLRVTSLLEQTFSGYTNTMKNPDWTNRFELVTRFCQTVDYEWSVTGNGDFIFEFPMYDFFPDAYGGNKSVYEVNKHVKSDNIADESGEVFAGIEASTDLTEFGESSVQKAESTAFDNASGAWRPSPYRTVIVFPVLASKYGARILHQSFTGVTPDGLQRAATIELQKRLADANKLSLSFDYRAFIRPNRPLAHITRGRVGKITSVTLNIPCAPREPTVSVALHAVRTPLIKKVTENGKPKYKTFYEHITGAANFPLSYNATLEVGNFGVDSGASALTSTDSAATGTGAGGNYNAGPQGPQLDGILDNVTTTEDGSTLVGSNDNPDQNSNWSKWDHLFANYGAKYGVKPEWLKAIALNESLLGLERSVRIGIQNPYNVVESTSEDGLSWGLMQVTLNTARTLDPNASSIKLNNPEYSIDLAAKYVAKSMKFFAKYRNDPRFEEYIIKSYNQGNGNTRFEITGTGNARSIAANARAQKYWERYLRNKEKVLSKA